MSATTTALPAPTDRPSTLETYRDDGVLAQSLGRALGSAVGLPPVVLVLAGAVALLAAVAIGGDEAPRPAVAGVIAWLVVAAGVSSGRPHRDRLRWAVPPLLRLAEYAGLVWLAALAGPSAVPAAFALIAALAFRHYDVVYRLRHRGVAPPTWLGVLAGGWDGRLVIGLVFLLTGALPAAFFVLAGLLGALFVSESVLGWTRFGRAQATVVYDDEEAEDE
ncbi:MAG TPA: DUF5941 domain-containing protein [Solirubrobacteraceae bacterium]|nr:DUF5941 domain-containing protein [Solirubrobacteraceae bacterium]